MTDPVAQAAAQIAADASPSSTEPTGIVGEIVNEFHKLEEKVEHLIHPDAPGNALAVAAASVTAPATAEVPNISAGGVEPASSGSEASAQTVNETVADLPNAVPTPLVGAATGASTGDAGEPSLSLSSGDSGLAEHPHTTILRRLTTTLRRKWNLFDGELEAILKDAESHL